MADIEATIATMARIPAKTVSKDDATVLKNLSTELKRLVFGQDKAIEALTSAIKLARAGLREPEKPIGSYLFSGPTGVGKTEVAKRLAEVLGVQCCALTCRNTWSAIPSPVLSAPLRAMWALTRAACSPMALTSIPIACCCSMKLKRPTRISSTSCCRSWTTASSPTTTASQ